IVVIKNGERGLTLKSAPTLSNIGRGAPAQVENWQSLSLWQPALQVEVAGTTGAGDAAIAGFLMGVLRGFGPERALLASAAAGACSCEAPDATSGARSWQAIRERLSAGWPTLPN